MTSSNGQLPKMILVDANFLVNWVKANSNDDDYLRIQHFLEKASASGSTIIIPTQVVAEFLIGAESAAQQILAEFEKKRFVKVVSFDRISAVECAHLTKVCISKGSKRDGSSEPWQKIKVDRQIIAIAMANNVKLIISSDKSLQYEARKVRITVVEIPELELPDEKKQISLALHHPTHTLPDQAPL